MSEHRTIAGRAVALGIGLLVFVVIAEIGLRLAYPHWREFFSGWFMTPVRVAGHGVVVMGKPGFDGYFAQNNGDFRVHIRINEAGFREDEPPSAADGRVWIVGDSMAFGWGVERDETYAAVIGRAAGMPTYNISAPGADVCGYQALAARLPAETRPRAVVVGLILENDMAVYDCKDRSNRSAEETGSAFLPQGIGDLKRRLTEYSALYNVVAVVTKRVGFLQSLLIRTGAIRRPHADHKLDDANSVGEMIESTANELARLREMFPGVPFAVLIAPSRHEMRDDDAGYRNLRRSIGAALAERGIAVIDPYEDFKSAGFAATHFAHDGHWSPLGHKLAGRAAAVWLQAQRLDDTNG